MRRDNAQMCGGEQSRISTTSIVWAEYAGQKKREDDGQKFGFQKTQKFVAWKRPGAEEAGACGKDANQKLRFDAE